MQAFYENPLTNETSFRNSIKQELAKIHKVVSEPSVEDMDFYPAPELVYNDALFVLEMLYHSGIPTPDISCQKTAALALHGTLKKA